MESRISISVFSGPLGATPVPASALGGALTIVCLYGTNVIWHITPPAEVASAVTVLVSFAAAWLAPPKAAA